MSVRYGFLAGLLCFCAVPAAAQEQETEVDPGPQVMSPVDFVELPRVGYTGLSPDGEQLILALTRTDWKKNKKIRDLQLLEIETGEVRDLPRWRGYSSDRNPAYWAPDGSGFVTTLKRRKEKTSQAYFYDAGSGSLSRLTDHPTSVSDLKWLRDSTGFFFVAGRNDDTPEEIKQWQLKPYDVSTPREIWWHDLKEKASGPVISGAFSIRGYALSDDGASIIHIRRPEGAGYASQDNEVWLYRLADNSSVRLTDNDYQEAGVRLSPDNSQFAFIATVNEKGEQYYEDNLFIQDVGAAEPELMLPDVPMEIVDFEWDETGDGIYLLGNTGVRTELYRLTIENGKLDRLTRGDHVVGSWTFDRQTGTHLARITSASNPGEIHIKRRSDRRFRQLTRVYEDLPQRIRLPKQEAYRWKGRDGTDLEGVLVYPVDHDASEAFPLVTITHGGPRSSSQFGSWNTSRYVSVLAGQGYGVFLPNHRGGTGYGDAFMRDMVGAYFRNAHLDVLDGIDSLIDAGLADPDRLVKMGWSAGGHMTNKLITFTDRFKAASSGAGASDWVSQYAESDVRHNRTPWFGGSPWEKDAPLESYMEQSMLKDAWRVTTPTLFFNGARDVRVPPTQVIMMYRGVRETGTPTALYLAPGEPHNFRRPSHQLFKINTELDWYATHVKGEPYQPQLPDVEMKDDVKPEEQPPEIVEDPVEAEPKQEQVPGA
ncbi:Dipeptidyl aminopeptidase/acylaminoacyl peptidase [Parasphingorhabdus marina DSM 22363]|uniref:Dipeptidyl aminopeptidase/acylaminoacyl peptidase n=1 Tax=Parasphingorhabdus marina DSM 22363 TaxID=1123272 RepID=A0A1N6DAU1_9SPHN|nr:prolyl oligopeptidase family serine peptidase [Parasphingorhabdus marina]SIN67918.1 Dipeptidyl aminopeptidase/acylaminoacyl peptidase [Parasphingorhabdus marina DSM 22363]